MERKGRAFPGPPWEPMGPPWALVPETPEGELIRMKMSVLLTLAALMALVIGTGTANAYAYEQRTRGLEQRWADAQAAGVPRAKIDNLRLQLKRVEAQRGGNLAYAATSMALVQNPVADLQRQTEQVYEQVTKQSRDQ